MSRGLGSRQRAILAALSEHEAGLCTIDLVAELDHAQPGPFGGTGYRTSSAACRRALGRLLALGLVIRGGYFPNVPGRPIYWQITEAGRAALGG